MGGKGGGSTTTVQQADPWSGQQPYLQRGYQYAQQNYNNPAQYYPNATYVPFSSQTENALGMAENRAMGSPLEGRMNTWLGNTLGRGGMGTMQLAQTANGNYLNANPYVDAMFGEASRGVTDQFNEAVMPSLNATFGGAGRTGSGAHALSAGRAAGDLSDSLAGMASNIYGGNYMNERGLQMDAARALGGLGTTASGMVPTASQMDWNNIAQLRNVGQAVEGMSGNILGDSMNRFNYYQNLPDQQLANYIAAIQGNVGGTTSTTQTGGGSNPLAGAAGGALAGAGLGSMMAAPGATGLAAVGGLPFLLGGALLGGLFS